MKADYSKEKEVNLFHTKKQKIFFFIGLVFVMSLFLKLWKLDFDSLWLDEIRTIDIASADSRSFENNYEYYFNKQYSPLPARNYSEVIDYLNKGGDSSHFPLYYCFMSSWLSSFVHYPKSSLPIQSIKNNRINEEQNLGFSKISNQISDQKSESIIRLPSVLFSIIASILLICICQILFQKYYLSLICALISCTSPYLFYYSQEARVYSLLILLVNLTVFVYLKMKIELTSHKSYKVKAFYLSLYLFLILAILALGISLHMTFIFFIPTLFIIGLIDFSYSISNLREFLAKQIKDKFYIFMPLIALLGIAFYWLLNKFVFGNFINQNFNFKEISNIGYVFKVGVSAIVHFSLSNRIPWPLYLSLIPIIFSIFSFYITSAFSKKIKLILSSWLLLPILFNAIAFLISNRSFSNSRYMIVADPAILLIISAGIYSLGKLSLNKSELSPKLGLADSVQNLFSKLRLRELSMTFIVLSYLLTIGWMKYTPQKQNWRLLGEQIEIKVNLHEKPTKVITQKKQETNKEKVIVYPSPTYLLIPLNYYWKSPRHEIKDLKTKLSNPNELPRTILIVMENMDLFDEEKKLLQNNGYIEISHEKFTGIHLKTFKQSN